MRAIQILMFLLMLQVCETIKAQANPMDEFQFPDMKKYTEYLKSLDYDGIVHVTLTLQVKAEAKKKFKALLGPLAKGMKKEPGRIRFAFRQGVDTNQFQFQGSWGHIGAFINHIWQPHSVQFREAATPLCERIELSLHKPIR